MEDKNKNDDFFKQIAQDKRIENPFDSDEILFRDKSGELKVIKEGETTDFNQKISTEKFGANKAVTKSSSNLVGPAIVVKEKEPPVAVGKPLNIELEIKQIIAKSGVDLSDEQDSRRFKAIITSRLKGVRDQVQTKEMLQASSLVGGMGYSTEIADKVLAIIVQEIEQLDGRLRDEVSSEPFSDLQAEANELLTKPSAEPPEPPSVVFNQVAKPTKTPPTPIQPVVLENIIAPQGGTVFQQPKSTGQSIDKASPPISQPRVEKPKIEDVKFKPKLTGPIEEIRSMSLSDFRRLGETAEEAINKIIEKVELLEEESFTKKTEAIKAWKESNIYRLYLELGDISMEEKKPISLVITERQKLNQPTLTEDELKAVIELNKNLRY
ncbi:MAG: hypothetical protein CMI53_02160 [Parcubacteria group bacterium]|nr:hypothetical protein [Parcubacteria group bacterium]